MLRCHLAGHNRPMHEVLFPRKQPLEPAFTNEFAGVTRDAITLASLEQTQEQQLPALQWKLLNLRQLKTRNPARFAAQQEELARTLSALRSGN